MKYTLFISECGIITSVKDDVSLTEAKLFYKDNPRGFYCNSEDFGRFANEQ